MKKNRNLFARIAAGVLGSLLVASTLAGCGSKPADTASSADASAPAAESSAAPAGSDADAAVAGSSAADQAASVAPKDGKELKIGVIQFMEHPSLDQAYKGFVEGLKKHGYEEGKNLKIDFQNAQGEQANCQTIAGQFKTAGYDLILAIATPAAQAVANVITDTPILVTAVTDLVSTQLVQSNEVPGGNVSGTSDMTPIDNQIKLIKDLFPNAKNLGIVYSSGEANSELQVKMAKEAAEKLGMTVKEATISSTNEIQQVTESIISDVDAIYLPSDNAIASSMPTIAKVAIDHKIPIIPAVEAMCAEGGLASVSINYFDLGAQTADMAVKVADGADISKMPVEFASNPELVINEDYAKSIGYTFPEDIKSKAREAKAE